MYNPIVRNSETDTLANDQINSPSYVTVATRFLEVVEQQSTLPQIAAAIDGLRSSTIVSTVLHNPKETVAVSVLQQCLNSDRCRAIPQRFLQRLLVVANTMIRLSSPFGGGTPTAAVTVRVNAKSVHGNKVMTTLAAHTISEALGRSIRNGVETFTLNQPRTHNHMRLALTDEIVDKIVVSMKDLQDTIIYNASSNNVQIKPFLKQVVGPQT